MKRYNKHFQAIGSHTLFEPQRTAYVEVLAEISGTDWQTAWRDLAATMRVTPDVTRLAIQLIDHRIHTPRVTATGRPAWLGEYHDLRELLGRRVFNPYRRLI